MKRIVMVGAGNLARHMSVALQDAGHMVVQVYSRTREAASELANQVNAAWTNEISEITNQGDLYILAVSDTALSDLIDQLKTQNRLIVHTSGSIGLDIFRGKAINYGVFYPLQTFSRARPVDFREIPLIIEGNNKVSERELFEIGNQISGRVIPLSSTDRLVLHLAAVFACNFTNHLYHLSALILGKKNLPFDLLLPLISETASKIETIPPGEGQTGPAIRNDRNVIKKHLDLLSFSPEIRKLYDLLSRNIYSFHHGEPDLPVT